MFGIVRLQEHSTRIGFPTCTARYLRKNLERAFCGSEIRKVERQISAEHPYQTDSGKIVTFHDHLGSNENVYFSLSKTIQNALQFISFSCAVPVEPPCTCFGKNRLKLLFHFLRSNTSEKTASPRRTEDTAGELPSRIRTGGI